MIVAAAVVIAFVTSIVIVACYKATGISIEVKSIDIKNKDKL